MLNKQTEADKKTPTKYSNVQMIMSACQGQDRGWFSPFSNGQMSTLRLYHFYGNILKFRVQGFACTDDSKSRPNTLPAHGVLLPWPSSVSQTGTTN